MLTEQQFSEIHSRYISSGLSIRSFCQNEGICESKFYYWKKKMKRFFPGDVSCGFVALVIRDSGTGCQRVGEANHRIVDSGFEICYPNGTRLKFSPEGLDLSLLRSLLSLQD
jgi:hypothetical protein